jgi:hypothetical protein
MSLGNCMDSARYRKIKLREIGIYRERDREKEGTMGFFLNSFPPVIIYIDKIFDTSFVIF